MTGFDLVGWRSACDRNRALATAEQVRQVFDAALAATRADDVNPLHRDLAAISAGLVAVLDLHACQPGPVGVCRAPAGVGLPRCRACSTRFRPVGWPCATRRVISRALDAWHAPP
ncbi:MAG TPA: hypothetical protein VIR27_06895 [Mycobacteriales bacterium]|jgi:hypothetical protein